MFLSGLRGGTRRAAPVLAAVAVLAWWTQPTAGATSPASLPQVRQQVATLRARAEVATEQYNATEDRITALQLRLTAAQAHVAAQEKALQVARIDLGRIAVDTYKAGDFATLSVFFGDDPDKLLAADGLFTSLGDQRAQAVQALQQQQRQLIGGMTDVANQQQQLQSAVVQLTASRRTVQGELAQAVALLSQLTDAQRGQLALEDAGDDRTSLADLGISVPSSGQLTCADVPITIPAGPVGKVLSYACAQIGDPYQWAAAGPDRFDCSGLTMRAWQQAGVDLPHNAAAQAQLGTPVTRAELQPGDLVFFHSPISHVAIYLGDGLMLHAPQTGDVVRIVPLRSDMVAAARY